MSEFDAPLLRLAWQFKADALARETAASSALVQAWGGAWQRLARDLAALTDVIDGRGAAGQPITHGMVSREERYRALLRQIDRELADLLPYADETIRKAQEREITAALHDTSALASAGLGLPDPQAAEVMGNWVALPKNAVTMMVGTLQQGSPLRFLLDELGSETSKGIQEHLVSGLAAGRNPRAIAHTLRDDFGMGLTRAMRISRTEILRSYRSASLEQYHANPGLVAGWQWVCSFSERTCIACLAQHGKVYPASEPMASHVCCRCTPVPKLVSWRELGIDMPEPTPAIQEGDGWRWFEGLAPEKQSTILGRPMFNAWKQGLVTPDQMWRVEHDAEWGDSVVANSVRRALIAPNI